VGIRVGTSGRNRRRDRLLNSRVWWDCSRLGTDFPALQCPRRRAMIRVTRKRLIVTTVFLLVLAGTLFVTWHACDWPPLRLILKYGLPPAGGPTGRRTMIEGIEFVELSPGVYRRGCDSEADVQGVFRRILSALGVGSSRNRTLLPHEPSSWVEIEQHFWISSTEIPQGIYMRLTEKTSNHDGEWDLPTIGVTWDEALEFCRRLSQLSTSLTFTLPSESQWEYACRAGSDVDFSFGSDFSHLKEHGWYDENSGMVPHRVGLLKPNRWGLFDLHGNVSEWCSDTWHPDYSGAPSNQAPWIDNSSDAKVIRGGSYDGLCYATVSYFRACAAPMEMRSSIGLRVVATSKEITPAAP